MFAGTALHPEESMRAFSRDMRRAAAFLASTRAAAPRWISGCAALSASAAAFLSPDLIASSTFLIEPRTRRGTTPKQGQQPIHINAAQWLKQWVATAGQRHIVGQRQ